MTRLVNLIDAAKYHRGEVHQNAAWMALDDTLTQAQRELFTRLYRCSRVRPRGNTKDQALDVEYFYQRDSKTGHGERSCQSSAIAMAVDYMSPGFIYDDDEYLNIVLNFGDTVSQLAHKSALDSIGIKNQFRMNGKQSDLLDLLIRGYPVPIGVLHKGTYDKPSGGGHWITLIGVNDDNFIVHDPFGEMDVINGGYLKSGPTDGKNVQYSKDLLMSRWLIANDCDGWLWDLSMNPLR